MGRKKGDSAPPRGGGRDVRGVRVALLKVARSTKGGGEAYVSILG